MRNVASQAPRADGFHFMIRCSHRVGRAHLSFHACIRTGPRSRSHRSQLCPKCPVGPEQHRGHHWPSRELLSGEVLSCISNVAESYSSTQQPPAQTAHGTMAQPVPVRASILEPSTPGPVESMSPQLGQTPVRIRACLPHMYSAIPRDVPLLLHRCSQDFMMTT